MTQPTASEALREALRAARDRLVTEVREGTRTLSDAYREDADAAKRWAAAVDRIQLAVAKFAIEADAAIATPPPALRYAPTWAAFEAWEAKAARQGSGMTLAQMTGAAMMLGWLTDGENDLLIRAAATPTEEPR